LRDFCSARQRSSKLDAALAFRKNYLRDFCSARQRSSKLDAALAFRKNSTRKAGIIKTPCPAGQGV